MSNVPLQSLSISDFRTLEGHRLLPLDAPVVLLHGPNGAGKTSVLSALELALTGDIRSMRRHDPRYTAHLPFHGQEFATLRVTVSDELDANREPVNMTVGGSRIEGRPALKQDAAQFYAERCYLDQVSLGQLLELYQYRSGSEESALARFVNELLGLEQLDALRLGLSDATDLRRLKNLCAPLADADSNAHQASADLTRVTAELESARDILTRRRNELAEVVRTLGLVVPEVTDEGFDPRLEELLRLGEAADANNIFEINRSLVALGGKIDTLSSRPSVQRLETARKAFREASVSFERWTEEYGPGIEVWRADASNLRLDLSVEESQALDREMRRIDELIASQEEYALRVEQFEQQLANSRAQLQEVQTALAGAQEEVGAFVEALTAIRDQAEDNICPVCDRDFSEVGATHLTAHIDEKVNELTTQGERLRALRQQRDAAANRAENDQQLLAQARTQLWSDAQREAVSSRKSALVSLQERLGFLQPAIGTGREVDRQRQYAKRELEELEATARDVNFARGELEELTQALGAPPGRDNQTLEEMWRQVSAFAADQLERRAERDRALANARTILDQVSELVGRVARLKDAVAESAERKVKWESRVREARRRQSVARSIQAASANARSAVVQRVFTESLNEVWRSVFTRLAPREPFVPAFGIPTSSRTALELTLQTLHASGEPAGSPQVMLSAGNLNTAALSLFIALHLAVAPLVPCLVFDDPVQSMDEVHVAQFAGLIRGLSKYHDRQVIIAVHERALFQYLALELSPAFEGDELITIELGARSEDEDRGIARFTWTPDSALAM